MQKLSKAQRLSVARAEHLKFLASVGYRPGCRIGQVNELPKYEYTRVTSDAIPGAGGYKRSVEDYKWRKDSRESATTVAEIERKKSRLAPAYNKGAVQYITDETDPRFIGRKL